MVATQAQPVTFTLGGRTIHGERFGPPGPIDTLFVHGWLDNLATFNDLIPLIEDTVSGIRFDLSGHGHSQSYPENLHDVTVVDWILDVVSACRLLSKKPLVLVGHSLGAGLCSMVAGLVPELIKGVILIDGLVPLPSEETDFCLRFRAFLEAKEQLSKKSQKIYAHLETIIEARLKVGDITPNLARAIVLRNVSLSEKGYIWSTDPRLKMPTVLRLTNGQILSVLKEIQCPCVLFKATRRHIEIDENLFKTFAQSIRDLEIHELPTGHYPHGEKPELIAAEILKMASNKIID